MKTPDQGGSYVRQKNGSLKRVEHTKAAAIDGTDRLANGDETKVIEKDEVKGPKKGNDNG